MKTIDIIWIALSVISYVVAFITFLKTKTIKIHRLIQLLIIILVTIVLPIIYGYLWLKYCGPEEFNNVQKVCVIALSLCFNFVGLCLLGLFIWILNGIKKWLCGKGEDLF